MYANAWSKNNKRTHILRGRWQDDNEIWKCRLHSSGSGRWRRVIFCKYGGKTFTHTKAEAGIHTDRRWYTTPSVTRLKIRSWCRRDSKPRITVLARVSRNLPDPTRHFSSFPHREQMQTEGSWEQTSKQNKIIGLNAEGEKRETIFAVFMAVKNHVVAFRFMTPCSLVAAYQGSGGKYCRLLQSTGRPCHSSGD